MLLWLNLLSNRNKMKSTNTTRDLQRKKRTNEWANWKRNNVHDYCYLVSQVKSPMLQRESIAAVLEKFRSLTISRSLSHPFQLFLSFIPFWFCFVHIFFRFDSLVGDLSKTNEKKIKSNQIKNRHTNGICCVAATIDAISNAHTIAY